jgi:hypothetical protein
MFSSPFCFSSSFSTSTTFHIRPYGLFPSELICIYISYWPVTVAERCEAWTAFARGFEFYSGHGCLVFMLRVRFLCLYTGRGLATSWSPVQGVLPTAIDLIIEVKRKVSWRRLGPELGCRAKGKSNISYWKLVRLLGRVISLVTWPLPTQNTYTEETRIYIHASSGIRTHAHNLWEGEESRGHCDLL